MDRAAVVVDGPVGMVFRVVDGVADAVIISVVAEGMVAGEEAGVAAVLHGVAEVGRMTVWTTSFFGAVPDKKQESVRMLTETRRSCTYVYCSYVHPMRLG